jgi:hypothetical protein
MITSVTPELTFKCSVHSHLPIGCSVLDIRHVDQADNELDSRFITFSGYLECCNNARAMPKRVHRMMSWGEPTSTPSID